MQFEKNQAWICALGFGELKHYKDDIYYNVDKQSTKRYWKDGKLHRDDGPAIKRASGTRFWYKEGKLHREDGPAVEYANGDKLWYIEGVKYTQEEFNEKIKSMHFEKNQAWTCALSYGELKLYKDEIYYNVDVQGNKRYWKDGNLHRDDGSAIECVDGSKFWFKEGKFHRLDGPARNCFGIKEWYIEGVEYTEEEFNQKIKIMEFEKDPKWSYALSCGELKHYKDEIYYNVDEFGDKLYWKDGICHRDDGPAVEYANGNKNWLKEDKYHRLDGPAIEHVNGTKSWWIEGKQYTEEEFNQKTKTEVIAENQAKPSSLLDILGVAFVSALLAKSFQNKSQRTLRVCTTKQAIEDEYEEEVGVKSLLRK